jgi:4-hydroxy-tetrahydrodipicolinate reductase
MESTPVRVCLAGATGRVGQALARAVADAADLALVAAVARGARERPLGAVLGDPRLDVTVRGTVAEALDTPADVLVDFTAPGAVKGHVLTALGRGVHAVVGTSGLTDEDYQEIHQAALAHGVGAFAAGNFALTAVLLQRFATIAARYVPHWEVIDYGHAGKPDAPSGTSRELAHRLAAVGRPQLGHPIEATVGPREARGATVAGSQVHSVRLPGYMSSVEVIFGLPGQRLSLRHDSVDAAAPYVAGALVAVRAVRSLRGLVRGLDRLLDLGGEECASPQT